MKWEHVRVVTNEDTNAPLLRIMCGRVSTNNVSSVSVNTVKLVTVETVL